jgi:hypothetical protein
MNADTGNGVASAAVTIYKASDDSVVDTDTTTAGGNCTLTAPVGVIYYVGVVKAGYRTLGADKLLIVTPDVLVANLTLGYTMQPLRAWSGVNVTEGAGVSVNAPQAPVDAVTVTVTTSGGGAIEVVTTDANGWAELTDSLYTGSVVYKIVLTKAGYNTYTMYFTYSGLGCVVDAIIKQSVAATIWNVTGTCLNSDGTPGVGEVLYYEITNGLLSEDIGGVQHYFVGGGAKSVVADANGLFTIPVPDMGILKIGQNNFGFPTIACVITSDCVMGDGTFGVL